MGFKDLANFNDALLAKQAWRLLHQRNSLFYRVFKARFFPHCSILEAPYSSTGSYAWHSILKGRDLVLKGARWRVGSGEAISVWNDAWLPSTTHPRIEAHVVPGFEDMKVSALIDPATKKWDLSMLNGLFTTQEVELISSIPLCPNAVEDVVVWPFTPSGNYTVKSGTRFLTSDQAPLQNVINAQPEKEVWKLIWSLNVQSKVRNFLWRSCHNAIPVKQNLKRRHILNEDICELCKGESESVVHALWGCSQLTQVWGSIPSFSFRQTQVFSSIQDVLTYTHKKQGNTELLASIMWSLWHRRNQVRNSSKEYPLSLVAPTATQALADFQRANSSDALQPRSYGQARTQWMPPVEGEIKVNFDGAQFRDLGKAGLGVIIRNSRGHALASLSEQAPLPFSPDIVEAMAAARAISFAQGLGFTSFILEGDSVNVIKAMQSNDESLSPYGHILSLAKSMVVTGSSITYSHVGRTGNTVAHNLAKHARHVRGFSVWTEDVPPHLSHVIFADHG